MMCSTWKISVFGIVALMLAFGLTAGDAFAHSDGHSEHTRSTVSHFTDATIIVKAYSTETTDPPNPNGNGGGRKDRDADGVNLLTAAPEDRLRATEVLDALEFVYTVGQTPVKEKGITITIPSGWTPATEDVNDGYNRDGEVELIVAGVMKRDKLRVTSRSMKFTGIDPALNTGDTVVFRFKRVKVPVRADTYEFGVISDMTGDKHVNKLNPHLGTHATQSDDEDAPPPAHDHGQVGTITLVVDEHTHPDDATHEHVDGNGVVDPPDPHTSHSTDHTHDAETKTVVTVDDHRHPFAADMEPHRHHETTGLVTTASDDDVHTHDGDNPYTNTHTHDEDGTIAASPSAHTHAATTGNSTSHTHDDDDNTVKDVAKHNHDAMRGHEHATGSGVTAVAETAHATDGTGTAHMHTSGGTGPVDSAVDEEDHYHAAATAPASVVSDTEHEASVHKHKSNRDVADVSTHSHQVMNDSREDGEDAVRLDHGHVVTGSDPDKERDAVETINGDTAGTHDTNMHTHASGGYVTGFSRSRHTHSTNTRDVSTHEHSTTIGDHANGTAVHRLESDEVHTLRWNYHTAQRFEEISALSAVPVHVHTGPGRTVEKPDETKEPWISLADRIDDDDNGIPDHTHASDGSVVIVTAHTHLAESTTLVSGDDGYVADEAVEISIFAHKHHARRSGQTFEDADGDSTLNHGSQEAGDYVTVTEHTHTGDAAGMPTVENHHHDTTGTATTGTDKLAHAGDTFRTAGAREIQAVMTAHTHPDEDTVDIAVAAHSHAMKDDANPIIVTDHFHDDDKTPVSLVDAHSHNADDSVRDFEAHAHVGVTAHKHEEGETLFDVIRVKAHTHASNRRVVDVGNHIHEGGSADPRIEGVDPREKHVHAILHNSKYAVRVGPVPSGSGELSLSNTGSSVRLTKRTAKPYKDQYVVTKGQDLGDLLLTFKATGTMVKGAGIRIELPDPNPGFPSFYEDNNAPGPPGGGGVRLIRGSVEFSADPENDDSDGISANALYFKTKSKLQAGNTFSVRVRDVMTNPHGDKANQDPTPTVEAYMFTASTASPLVPPDGDNPIAGDDLVAVEKPPTVVITGQHGNGEISLEARDPRDGLTQAATGEGLSDVVITFKAKQPMGMKSQVEVTVDPAWPTNPFPPADSGDSRPGAVLLESNANATLKINSRVWTATIEDGLAVDDTLTFTYRKVKAPAEEGRYGFTVKSKSGPHGNLTSLHADQQKKLKVDITTGHGSGTVSLRRGGTTFREADKETKLGTLVFTYMAAGRMAKDALVRVTVPLGWTAPAYDNGDSRAEGVVTLTGTGKAGLEITGGGSRPWYLIAKLSEPMTKNQTLVFTYRNVTAPATPGSYTFTTSATAFPGALEIDDPGAELQSGSPEVGVDQAPDGSGAVAVSSSARALEQDTTGAYGVNVGESLGNLAFTFTATGKMESGGAVTLTIPTDDGWDAPTYSNTEVTPAGVAAHGVLDDIVSATLQSALEKGDTLVITYKSVTAPSSAGRSEFTMQSQSTSSGGELKNLTVGSPTIVVGDVPVGKLVITTADGELTSAGPGMSIGDVTLTFTATAPMSAGATVNITVPAGWSVPGEDNDDGVDREGEVVLSSVPADVADFSVSGGGAQPWQLVATTNAALATGDTLVFTYKMVTTPSTPKSYDFTTTAAASATSDPVPIVEQPETVIVRAMVTGIAIEAADSFFAGDSLSGKVTLWSGTAAANALGDTVIYLSTSSETGSFGADMITIGDNMPGAAFSYMDTTAGTVTLTASTMMPAADDATDTGTSNGAADTADASAGLMTTKVVTVKSGVSSLKVDPTLVKAGSDITVTATGKAGGGTVMVMDSEGMQVGKTKSLDPVGTAGADGNQEYNRTVTLPDDLADGTYTVSVDIQGLMDSMDIEVLNDQTPPTLSGASVTTSGAFMKGAVVTVTASATSDIGGIMVTADVSALDSTKADAIGLTQLTGTDIYTTIFTISDSEMNTAEDGDAMITITATDRIKNSSMTTVTVELDNVADDMLDSVSVEPAMAKAGESVSIMAMGSTGAEASATVNDSESGMMIAQVALEEMEDAAGSYAGSLMIVEDAHPVGSYDVTVTLGNADPMTKKGALTIEAAGYTFTLSIPAGTHLIHVPLDVNQVDGADMMIGTVGDLHSALGDAVNFIISLGADGSWNSYLGDASAGTAADAMIGDSTGLIAVMKSAATLVLGGEALGTGGVSTIMLNAGNNLVGVPLDSAQLSMISDALSPLVSAIVVSNAAGDGFNTIAKAGDPGDGPLMGGTGYIVVANAAASIPIIGAAWQDAAAMPASVSASNDNGASNGNGASAAPSVGFRTPVLQVQGKLIDAVGMVSREGLNVSVKNLTSGVVLGRSTATDSYSMTFVKLDSSAAKIGDVLEIRADSMNPLLGIRPVQHVVTSEDVLNNRISLPDLVTYEIPAQTELLANYPNPFNPETWIPFRLAEDSAVSLTIYGASGSLVRTIDLGFTPAAVYEGRSDAIYWDGRNNFGEQVSSGIYFYHLNAGDFSATRKMVIVK